MRNSGERDNIDMANTLISKIASASIKVGALKPDKTNTQQSYDYISADKVLERAGDALAAAGVVIIPSIQSEACERVETGNGKSRFDSTVTFTMIVTDGETQLEMSWRGRGSDYSVPDKAMYKAITSGHKYFLMKLLNVGVGNEDGEHESDPQQAPQRAQATKSTRNDVPQQPAAQPVATDNPFTDSTPYFVHAWYALTGKEYDLVQWTSSLHKSSDGPATARQYQYLSGLVGALTNTQHGYVLSVLCQAEISKSNMPGRKIVGALLKLLAITVKGKDEQGNEVDVPNPDYRQDIANMLTSLAQQPQAA